MIDVTITLGDGRKMEAELDRAAAPLSADNFVRLAKAGFYDGLIFHRVIEGFMIQGGGFRWENGLVPAEGAGKPIKGEFAANGVSNPIRHVPGVLSMARTSDPNSATSQFFICVADCAYLDGQYAAFGRLKTEADLAVAKDVSRVATGRVGYFSDVPVEPVIIASVTVGEERE